MQAALHHPAPTLPEPRLPAPSSWDQAVYRGCSVCVHGRTAAGEPTRPARATAATCSCPAVTGGRRPVPVAMARANTGPCGPEATHQHFPGL